MKLKATLAALVGSALLFGSAAASAETELKVWCWDDHFNVPAAKMAAQRYQARHPGVTVKVESIAQADIVQRLNAALGANNVRSLPDVVLIEDNRIQNFLIGYPDFLKEIGSTIDTSRFVDYKVKASSDTSGKVYGVPFDSGVTATFLRKDLFEKAGYTLDDFQDITWDQFIEMGKKVKETTGVYLFGYDPSDLGIIRVMMQSAGMWYTNNDATKVTIADNPALKEAMLILKKMQDEDLVTYYNGWTQMLASFQQGLVATVVQGCWVTPSVEANTENSGNWRIAPIPKLSTVKESTHYSNLGGSQWYVNNYSKNADVAVDFLNETFATDEQLLNELVTKISLVNSLKDTTKISNYNVANAFFGDQKIYADFARWNTQVPALNYGPHTYAIESVVSEALQRVLAGEDIDEVLKDTQTNAEMQVGL
ncbi:MAG: extracellular solute-binding protein [Candidatus Anaerobiospirillum pullicola]|uniref:Extracellular solute-binding protein n=1 Tax=Candidatus Anaerobiospirillum pullicola TaxID=2838451 RepID=A0A948TES1_9GAMM|nr:extracellular solute-binding protein [Candidatus Anaerobiospirillum pullicola]